MKNLTKTILFFGGFFCCISSYAQNDGVTLFKTNCSICHTVTNQKLVGPGLGNIHLKRSEDWFISFVKSSQTMIKNGDPDAVAIFEEYNKVIMPDQNLSDSQLKLILDYIIANSPEETSEVAEVTDTPIEEEEELVFTEKEVLTGQNLFVGKINFRNGGPTCNSCHNVKTDDVVTGGALAKDLTESYSLLSGAGMKAILGAPPFPAMRQAYDGKSLTDEEIHSLLAYLKTIEEQQYDQHPRDYGQRMLITGLLGAFLLMGIFPALWYRRKKRSVNQRIYDRQLGSSN